MTRNEIEAFIFDTMSTAKDEVAYEEAIKKIAERWEDDVERARQDGIHAGQETWDPNFRED